MAMLCYTRFIRYEGGLSRMNELTKIDYTAPVEDLLPVSNKHFPSEEFVDFSSELGRMYYGG